MGAEECPFVQRRCEGRTINNFGIGSGSFRAQTFYLLLLLRGSALLSVQGSCSHYPQSAATLQFTTSSIPRNIDPVGPQTRCCARACQPQWLPAREALNTL